MRILIPGSGPQVDLSRHLRATAGGSDLASYKSFDRLCNPIVEDERNSNIPGVGEGNLSGVEEGNLACNQPAEQYSEAMRWIPRDRVNRWRRKTSRRASFARSSDPHRILSGRRMACDLTRLSLRRKRGLRIWLLNPCLPTGESSTRPGSARLFYRSTCQFSSQLPDRGWLRGRAAAARSVFSVACWIHLPRKM